MSQSTVKIICPENEDDVSSVINVIVYLWKKKLIFIKTAMANPIMIMLTTTSDGDVVYFIQQQSPSGVIENKGTKISSENP